MLFLIFSTEQAAGVYHRESRNGKYQLTYREARAVCEYEGGQLATYDQLEEARKIGTGRCKFWKNAMFKVHLSLNQYNDVGYYSNSGSLCTFYM